MGPRSRKGPADFDRPLPASTRFTKLFAGHRPLLRHIERYVAQVFPFVQT
ncbi:MAG: hypothetical protein JWO59_3627 [Chloroflexi bacterium]|nr:hypothetical protein [Chloroflexota bacterium]